MLKVRDDLPGKHMIWLYYLGLSHQSFSINSFSLSALLIALFPSRLTSLQLELCGIPDSRFVGAATTYEHLSFTQNLIIKALMVLRMCKHTLKPAQ